MSSQLVTGCRERSLKTSPDFSAWVDMQLGKGTWHLFQVSLLFLRISVPCLIVWLEFLTLGKLLNQLNLWVWLVIRWSPVCNWTENLAHCSPTFSSFVCCKTLSGVDILSIKVDIGDHAFCFFYDVSDPFLYNFNLIFWYPSFILFNRIKLLYFKHLTHNHQERHTQTTVQMKGLHSQTSTVICIWRMMSEQKGSGSSMDDTVTYI